VHAADALEDDQAGQVIDAGEPVPIPRFAVVPPTRATHGHVEAMALYAGQSVGAVTAIPSAAEVVHEIVGDARQLLHHARDPASGA